MTTFDDEIDLQPYINAILKNWWKIGLLAISLAGFVFIITRQQIPSYESTATILVPHRQLKLSLADQFPTIVDDGDARSRMSAYLAIARSDAIAHQTYQALKDYLPAEYSVENLQNNVDISNSGDVILIAATAPASNLAARIANEWAIQTVHAINLAYSGEQPLEQIQLQLAAASEKYQGIQKELEAFIEKNPITEIQTTLDLSEAALNSYKNDQVWNLNYLYNKKQQFIKISDQANFIQNQVERGNKSMAGDVGDALAVMSARANKFFADDPASTVSIQITDPTTLVDSSTNYAQDIAAVYLLSNEMRQQVNQDLEALFTGSYLGVEEAYTKLASDIQLLKSQQENLIALERELTSGRDLAWDTYQVLLQKETEIKTTAQTNDIVTFASPAIPPGTPVARQTVMKTAIAGMIGGLIGVLWVVVRVWWQSSQLSDKLVSTKGSSES